VEVIVEARGPLLDTGTVSEEWRILKEMESGPEGKNGFICVSDPMIEIPFGLWVVATTRGAARGLEERMMLKELIGGGG